MRYTLDTLRLATAKIARACPLACVNSEMVILVVVVNYVLTLLDSYKRNNTKCVCVLEVPEQEFVTFGSQILYYSWSRGIVSADYFPWRLISGAWQSQSRRFREKGGSYHTSSNKSFGKLNVRGNCILLCYNADEKSRQKKKVSKTGRALWAADLLARCLNLDCNQLNGSEGGSL
eukprot:scaffold103898_cov35-Prasinocladus_malaysianus.AAC.1